MSHVVNGNWQIETPEFHLGTDKIHIWSVNLNIDTATQIHYWKILTSDEKEIAARFKFIKDKIRYIACRATLRFLLGKYLKQKPELVKIVYVKNGKPYHYSNIEFNVSHSGEWAVIGLNVDHILGIDIEVIKRDEDLKKLAERFFSYHEAQKVINAPSDLLPIYFYNCWTRKEAFIKAIGEGLSFPLDQFEVSCAPEETARLTATKWDKSEVKKWSMWSFKIDDVHVGAITIKGPEKKVSYFSWKHVELLNY